MLTGLFVLFGVVFLDVLLSGDNAVIVGMAANTLPKEQRTYALIFGMGFAALVRIILSLVARSLLQYRWVSIIGGIVLLIIVIKLTIGLLKPKDEEQKAPRSSDEFWKAIGLIAFADISMSLDNILSVAAVARNNPVLLALGLIISIGFMGFGAKLASMLLEKWKWLNWAGVVLISFIAIDLIFGLKTL